MVSIYTDYYIEEQKPVFIDYNNEIGDWLYSVALYDCRDDENGPFWIRSYPELKHALNFCEKHKLPLMGISENYSITKEIKEIK